MASSVRRRLFAVAALAAIACAGALAAIAYLSETSTREHLARADETVAREVERLARVLERVPFEARARHGRRGRGELHSGWTADPSPRGPGVVNVPGATSVPGDANVTEAVQASAVRGELVILDRSFENAPIAVAAAPVDGGGFAWATLRVVTAPETRLLRGAVLLLALVTLLLVGVSVQTVVAVDRSVTTLRGSLAAVERDLGTPIERPEIREFAEVASGIAALTQALERAQAERERLTEELAAKERLAALGRVAAGVAHEVRNPLAAIKLRTDLAQSNQDLPPGLADDLAVISAEIARLDRMVADLLVVAGRRAGSRHLQDLGALATARVELLSAWASERGVFLEATGRAQATIDADAVARALDNLLRNAVEASPKGARVEVLISQQNDAARLAVLDEGTGVPTARAAELFEPFFTTKPEGTGLGLALSRAVARAHGGDLTYARQDGRTSFTLELPSS